MRADPCVFVLNPKGIVHAISPQHAAELVTPEVITGLDKGYKVLARGTDPRQTKDWQERVKEGEAGSVNLGTDATLRAEAFWRWFKAGARTETAATETGGEAKTGSGDGEKPKHRKK